MSRTEGSIMVAEFPKVDGRLRDPAAVEEMKWVKTAISAIRNIRGELSILPSERVRAIAVPNTSAGMEHLERNRYLIEKLARVNELEITRDRTPPERAVTAVTGFLEVFISIDEARFMEERRRLEKEIQKTEKDLIFVAGKLSNEAFLTKAPQGVVEKEKRKQAELEETKQRLEEGLRRLENLNRSRGQ